MTEIVEMYTEVPVEVVVFQVQTITHRTTKTHRNAQTHTHLKRLGIDICTLTQYLVNNTFTNSYASAYAGSNR